MLYFKISNLNKSFINKEIFSELNLTFSEKDRVGIIGKNGEGKTTLLKMIAGMEKPDNGTISFSEKNISIGYFDQKINSEIFDDESIEEYVMRNTDLHDLYRNIYIKKNESTLIYDIEEFEEKRGYEILASIDTFLIDLGLINVDSNSNVRNLSGGQKTRLKLISILIKKPQILLLDEPTNYLDLSAIKWLENFINNYEGIVVVISHDRSFLNNTVNQILEIDNTKYQLYLGDYDSYQEQKNKIIEKNEIKLKINNKKIVRLAESTNAKKSQANAMRLAVPDKDIDKFARGTMNKKVGQKSKDVKLMNRRIDAMINENDNLIESKYRKMKFDIKNEEIFSDFILKIHNYDLVIGDRILIYNINLDLFRGKRIAIQGENGCGKTTLLKVLIASVNNENPKIKFGNGVKIGYFSQERNDMNIERTVIDWFRDGNEIFEDEAANHLYNMQFTWDQISSKIKSLSEGEKAKLALSKLILGSYNLLILDEPTSHLDILSQEAFEKTLKVFQGNIIIVSHDRYLLKNLKLDRVYEIQNKQLNSLT